MLAVVFQIVGFALIVAGMALWSVPASLVVAGVLLFVCGGLEEARR